MALYVICSVLGRAMAWQPNISYWQDCTIFFILINNVNNEIKNKVLTPYVNFPCYKVAHTDLTSSFSILAILLICIMATAEGVYWSHITIIDIRYLVAEVWLAFIGMLLGTILGFSPSISVCRWWTWHMITILITSSIYLSFCIFCGMYKVQSSLLLYLG